jgi:acetylornithine deacetylase/succinyl-diaminopimelate desuccinylase-like protein
MSGGYTATEGWSNIIPGKATARINCRLVNNQSGAEIVDLIVKHNNKYRPPGATVSYKIWPGFTKPMKFPADTKAYQYVSASLQNVYGRPALQTTLGGSIGPLSDIKEHLDIYAYSFSFSKQTKIFMQLMIYKAFSLAKGNCLLLYFQYAS